MEQPTIAVIGDRLYGYGGTPDECWKDFLWNICGGTTAMQAAMAQRVLYLPVDDDTASEVAEMLGSTAIAWEN